MSKTQTKKETSTENDNIWILSIFLSIVLFILAIKNDLWILKAFMLAFPMNFLVYFWNIFIYMYFIHATLRLFIVPLWKTIFIDTNKFGAKLEWYDNLYKHLSPKKVYEKERFIVCITVAFTYYTTRFLPFDLLSKYSLALAEFRRVSDSTIAISNFYSKNYWILDYILPIVCIIYFVYVFESRTRIIVRVCEKRARFLWDNIWRKKLPKNPFNENSESFKMSIFTSFVNQDGEISKEVTNDEAWEVLDEKSIRANILCIGPIGSGKTEGFIKPTIEQCIFWNRNCNDKKSTIAVYDPKGTLALYVKSICEKLNCLNDIVLLSLDSEHSLNIIKINNIWRDDSAYKVTGWILGSWANFQGKTSPEPYWENQNFILIRNLLINLYVAKRSDVTLYDVSKKYGECQIGCYTEISKGKRLLTPFGVEVIKNRIMSSFENADIDQIYEYLDRYEIPDREKDYTKFTREIIDGSRLRREREMEEYKDFRKKFHISMNPDLIRIKEEARQLQSTSALSLQKREFEIKMKSLHDDYTRKLDSLVDSDMKKKFDDKEIGNSEFKKTLLIREALDQREIFIEQFKNDDDSKTSALSIIKDSCDWLIENWSSVTPENRGNIVSNLQPFLNIFEQPKIKKIFSPSGDTLDFNSIITEGKILCPSFPANEVGDGISSAIITLIKSRWQHTVLETKDKKRLKIQIIDEYQKVATFNMEKSTGDFEFAELSREFGGCSIFATQSISAVRQRASKNADFEKIHGVIRTIINFPTNDPDSISFLQKVAGKKETKRISRTVQEGASSPDLDNITEKYVGNNSNLSISFTESEGIEDVIQSYEIQAADAWTGIGVLYDGKQTRIKKLAFKPSFMPESRLKWKVMQMLDFIPSEKNETFEKYKKFSAFLRA